MHLLPALRLARPADAGAIARMSRDQIEQGLGWSWSRPRVLRAILDPATNVVVAGQDPALAGFGIMEYGDENAHLNLLAVAPACRRRGLATDIVLWLEICAVTAGLARIRLEARADNPGALAFYRCLGYRVTARTAGYYRGEVDALRLEKRLPGA